MDVLISGAGLTGAPAAYHLGAVVRDRGLHVALIDRGGSRHRSCISAEAASLAGHLRLSNLCWIYDNNHITIEGNTSLAFSEDVAGRFLAYGWNVQRVSNANDLDLLWEAFDHFKPRFRS